MSRPRMLTIDLETSPNIADVWQLFNQNVSLNQLRQSTRMLCFAAKWHDERQVIFRSEFHDGTAEMVSEAWRLLDEADFLITYNGNGFDIPHLKREFILAGLPPPAPFDSVDLLRKIKKEFRFSSNKLDHVSAQILGRKKVKHEGHELWVKCMAGDEKAWARMRRYCMGDVRLTERLYDAILPWIAAHPHMGLYRDPSVNSCQNCGSDDLQQRGFAYTKLAAYPRFRCNNCGKWGRGARREAGVDARGVS